MSGTEYLNFAVWSRDELIEAFMPIWEKIYFQEPEGILFRLPVDPVALGVPVSRIVLYCHCQTFMLTDSLL